MIEATTGSAARARLLEPPLRLEEVGERDQRAHVADASVGFATGGRQLDRTVQLVPSGCVGDIAQRPLTGVATRLELAAMPSDLREE